MRHRLSRWAPSSLSLARNASGYPRKTRGGSARRGAYANLAFVKRVAPKFEAAIEAGAGNRGRGGRGHAADLIVTFERIEAAGYMTKRMRPVQEVVRKWRALSVGAAM
jgi:hypothetical protein